MTPEEALNNIKRGKCIPYKRETIKVLTELVRGDSVDDFDPCYECRGYGDDYRIEDDGNLISNCEGCPNNPNNRGD